VPKTTREEAWRIARLMVVEDGLAYADVAEQTGLPLSTLQKRAAREGWQDQRAHDLGYSAKVAAMKRQALADCIDAEGNVDPQKVYAWKAIEQVFPEHRYGETEDGNRFRSPHLVEFIEELVAYLEREDRTALEAVAPHVRPFVEQLEATWRPR